MGKGTFLDAARCGAQLRRTGFSSSHTLGLDAAHPVPTSAAFDRMKRRAFAAKGKTCKHRTGGKRK